MSRSLALGQFFQMSLLIDNICYIVRLSKQTSYFSPLNY